MQIFWRMLKTIDFVFPHYESQCQWFPAFSFLLKQLKNCLPQCSTEERNSHRFENTWGRVNNPQPSHTPLLINNTTVEVVNNTAFLRVIIRHNPSWSENIESLVKRAQHCLNVLQRLRRAHLPLSILTTCYRSAIDSNLTTCIYLCGGCSESDWKRVR